MEHKISQTDLYYTMKANVKKDYQEKIINSNTFNSITQSSEYKVLNPLSLYGREQRNILLNFSFADPQKKVLWVLNDMRESKFFIQIFFTFSF